MVQAVRRRLLTAEVLVLVGDVPSRICDESNVILKFSSKFRTNPVSIIPHMLCIHLRIMSRVKLEKNLNTWNPSISNALLEMEWQ